MNCDSYEVVRDHVRTGLAGSTKLVIIEGASGSGKTAIAKWLAREFCGARVSSDSYVLAGSGGSYLKRLDFEFLSDDLMRFMEAFPVIFLEGICARDILTRVGMDAGLSIYVKETAKSGLWHFEHHLHDFFDGSQSLAKEPEPYRSDYEYHIRVRPQETCNITYMRIED